MKLYGGIEAGGTKMVCTVSSGPDHVVSEERFPTTTPEETIQKIIAFFSSQMQQHELVGVGIGSFGPVDHIHVHYMVLLPQHLNPAGVILILSVR